jgi:hypothetical protein
MKSLKSITALALMIIAITATGLAQEPTQKEVVLTVNVPYQLRMGNYMLSTGTYTIYQVSPHDPNLFYLYKGVTKTHSPIAAIRTARVEHAMDGYPGKTHMRWQIDEESSTPTVPVITGWDIPGEDGWEIISVVARRSDRSLTAILR